MNRSMVKQIVLATDFSECAGKAQDYAAFLPRTYEANLSVIHVPESPLWYGSNAATILYLVAVCRPTRSSTAQESRDAI